MIKYNNFRIIQVKQTSSVLKLFFITTIHFIYFVYVQFSQWPLDGTHVCLFCAVLSFLVKTNFSVNIKYNLQVFYLLSVRVLFRFLKLNLNIYASFLGFPPMMVGLIITF